jgi:flagellin-like protein
MFTYCNFVKLLSLLQRDEKGLSGLETAIILIAFVTVAAVFSYAVVSAGLFASDREKETLHQALKEASNNLEISGSVIAIGSSETDIVDRLVFCVKNAAAGNPMDLTPCDGTATAANSCVITLTTPISYINNV